MSDLISRTDAIEAVCGDCTIENREFCKRDGYCYEVRNLMALQSAVCDDCIWHVCNYNKVDLDADKADSDDLIIKGAKGIQDGLYNIKDGKLYKYKAKGGTVRTYEIVPSAEAVHTDCTDFLLWLLEEIMDEENWELNAVADGEIIARKLKKLGLLEVKDGYYVRTPSAEAVQGWIPCSERLPKELERVNVTWINHNPPAYYQHIKDIPQTDTAVYYRDKWYWWDATVIDVLAEYGEDCKEQINKDIELVAWMPLQTPYKGGDSE